MQKINGVLFDMDGTVLDSEALFEEAQILLLEEYNVKASSQDFEEFRGMSYKHFYPTFMSKFNIKGDIDSIRNKIRTYLHKLMETKLKYIAGFEDFYIRNIKNTNLKVGLVTNTTRLSYQKIQSCINIDDYFNYVQTVTESLEPKPSPKAFSQAMESLSLKEENTIIIEDSKTGLISASGTNAKVIAIKTSITDDEIKSISNDIIITENYKEIENYFKKLII